MEYLFLILFIIITIFLLISKFKLLTNNVTAELLNNKNYPYLIKYSSIDNKLNTVNDYVNLSILLNDFKDSIYYSIIDTISIDEKKIIELIINDIFKTKMKYNFKKLNNIYLIIKKINENFKIIIFYDGLLFSLNKNHFIEDDFSGSTIVYKLDLNDKLFNHYLQ